MKKEKQITLSELKEKLKTEIKHFEKGGNLWFYTDGKWYKQEEVFMNLFKKHNIIEDENFKARQAFALGQVIEEYFLGSWVITNDPKWETKKQYRPKEIIYEWQYIMKYNLSDEEIFLMTDEWFAEGDSLDNYDNRIFVEKYEPSKRIRDERSN